MEPLFSFRVTVKSCNLRQNTSIPIISTKNHAALTHYVGVLGLEGASHTPTNMVAAAQVGIQLTRSTTLKPSASKVRLLLLQIARLKEVHSLFALRDLT